MGGMEEQTFVAQDQGVVCESILPLVVMLRQRRITVKVNQRDKIRNFPKLFRLLIAAAIILAAGSASAIESPQQGAEILLETYHRNMARLEKSSSGPPLLVESFERDDTVHVDVYGIFDYPFSSVADALKVPANWCDIVSLHPNIKACTNRELAGACLLTFYLGKKTYQPPEDTRQVKFHYRNVVQQQGYLDITLNADAGPYGTRDHRMRFEAIPLDVGKTFVHVSYAYSDSAALRLVIKIYFATLGRDKVGFTVIGTDRNSKPIYIGGPRGAVERTAVRFYFAIQSFMNTLRYPEESRFSMRINEWYSLTSRYGKQLFDLDKKDYLASKTKERATQVILQRQIDTCLQ